MTNVRLLALAANAPPAADSPRTSPRMSREELTRELATIAASLVMLAKRCADDDGNDADALIPIDDAVRIAGLRSKRPLTEARRSGELVMFGGQRSRAVRRRDLMAWIESRRAPIVRDVIDEADDDIARRMRSKEKKR